MPEHTSASRSRRIADAGLNKPVEYSLVRFVSYFLRLGTTGFGGPIALTGRMQQNLVDERRWIGRDEFLEGLAFSQLMPGPLAAQLAIYLGYIRAGIPGAALVGIAFVLPSFLMVLVIAVAYSSYGGLHWVRAAFYGISAAIVAIISRSTTKLVRMVLRRDPLLWFVFLLFTVVTAVTEREIVWLFLAAGFLAMFLQAGLPKIQSEPPLAFLVFVSFSGNNVWELFAFFVKASLFVFGSGLAIVPFLHGGVVQERHWLTEQQFVDAIAVAMITPGPVVITVAFIGYLVAKLPGAISAAAGVFLPVYLSVILCAPYYKKIACNLYVHSFVKGVTAAATGADRRSHDCAGASLFA